MLLRILSAISLRLVAGLGGFSFSLVGERSACCCFFFFGVEGWHPELALRGSSPELALRGRTEAPIGGLLSFPFGLAAGTLSTVGTLSTGRFLGIFRGGSPAVSSSAWHHKEGPVCSEAGWFSSHTRFAEISTLHL